MGWKIGTIAALALAMGAGSAGAQQTLSLPSTVPAVISDDDAFSSSRMGEVRFGPFPSTAYARIELAAIVLATGTDATFALRVALSSLDPQGDITSVAARGGIEFTPIGRGSAGRINCSGSRYSSRCRNSYARTFELPKTVLEQLRNGESVDVRIRTTEGASSDLVVTLTPAIVTALDKWFAPEKSEAPKLN